MSHFQNKIEAMILPLLDRTDENIAEVKVSSLLFILHVLSKINKAGFYIAQYPVLRTVQSASHFTSLTDLFTQTPSRLLWEASSHMLQLMHEGCSYTHPPLSIARFYQDL